MAAKMRGRTFVVTGKDLVLITRVAKRIGVRPKWVLIHALVELMYKAVR